MNNDNNNNNSDSIRKKKKVFYCQQIKFLIMYATYGRQTDIKLITLTSWTYLYFRLIRR